MMMKMRHRMGDILFREGDPSDFACRVVDGELEAVKEIGGHSLVVGIVRAGEFIGEMGVIEMKPRSATIRALSDVTVEVIPRDDFLRYISEEKATAFDILVRLSQKVRTVSEELARLMLAREAAAPAGAGGLPGLPPPPPYTLPPPAGSAASAASPRPGRAAFSHANAPPPNLAESGVTVQLTTGGALQPVAVTGYPFLVGRVPGDRDMPDRNPHCLRLTDQPPYRLSVNHFAIDRKGISYTLQDLDSELGTNVNGEYLGGIIPRETTYLRMGENKVVAGGCDSPFIFRVEVR